MNKTTTESEMLNCIKAVQNGQTELFAKVLKTFDQAIINRIKSLNISKEDSEDLAQIIRYKLYKQVLTYDCQDTQSFAHCVNVIIKNVKIDYIRKIKSEKYHFHNSALTIDGNPFGEDLCLYEKVPDCHVKPLEESILIEQFLSYLLVEQRLTVFEVNIVKYVLEGQTKKEISERLNVPIKHIYNAQYRIKKKLNKSEIISALFDN
ncbi:sigma-70 family RNA polymerase sigma factor [Mammaliicoccus stepanovicii]|uniref:RNA polymerase sigma factor n=1 Tax=Mammaliicoccus stepanovicii TaxID=643214 RepID=A0A240AB09_9STAP|nr:sigma-70 family RNA polymerase sigma factor [Mammaliicoccus stepanovicii]PNZ77126.1 sigma-70 family RNA polymerase sigma factor [Mammaliicoccus stepanovicii]GGI39749.1 RNA polymerase sigma factor SigW [Mammaliicoccus stepanovicii]SNV80083.1 RNA polymerase sigma factor [Mammaliicoccus stepanovicii]